MKTIKFTALLTILLTIPLTILFAQNIWASCGNTPTIQIGNPGPGYESTPNPNEQSNNGLPDFIVKKVILTDISGNEKYKFYKNDEVKIRALLKNIGDNDVGNS